MQIQLCAFADEASSDLKGQIDALQRNNIKFIELRNVGGKNVVDLSISEAEQIKRELNYGGIEVFSIGSPIGKSHLAKPREYEEKRLRHLIQLAKTFNTDKIRIFSYFTANFEIDADEVFARLNSLVGIAAKEGIKLCHENEKEIYGDIAERVLKLWEAVKDLKIIYDPANFIQTGENADYCIIHVAPKAEYMHIKDVIAKTMEVVPAGMGDGKIKELIDSVKRDIVLSIEPHLAVFDGYSSIDNTKMKNKFLYASNVEAFDAAVNALKNILMQCGFVKEQSSWIRK